MEQLMVKDSGWLVMKEQATMLVKSGFLPSAINTPEKAIAIILKGSELGLPMMQSLGSINVIQGKPTISAELMAALVYRKMPDAILNCTETSDKKATYEAKRPNGKLVTMSFTWEDAVKAGVTGKDNWKNYPAAMLRARACSAICRVVFPDAIMGVYTPDEMGAIVDEEGLPITQVEKAPEPIQDVIPEEPKLSSKDELLGELILYCEMEDGSIDPNLEATVLTQIGAVDKEGKPGTIEKLRMLDETKHKKFFDKLLKAWKERG